MSSRASAFGRSLLRVEDEPLLRGTARFVDDLALDGAVHAAFVRSPIAHARIVALRLEAARAAEGVAARSEPPSCSCRLSSRRARRRARSRPRGRSSRSGVVRFAGEPVAIIAADSRYAAEDALELVELDLDPLEAVADLRRALEDDAPRLHDHHSNVYVESRLDVGNVDEAFARAAVVVERSYVTAASRRCRSSRAVSSPRPRATDSTIWASTQGPHKLQLDARRASWGCRSSGSASSAPTSAAASARRRTCIRRRSSSPGSRCACGRPVKWVEDRSENLLASSHAREQDADGAARRRRRRTRARRSTPTSSVDQGAYGTLPARRRRSRP